MLKQLLITTTNKRMKLMTTMQNITTKQQEVETAVSSSKPTTSWSLFSFQIYHLIFEFGRMEEIQSQSQSQSLFVDEYQFYLDEIKRFGRICHVWHYQMRVLYTQCQQENVVLTFEKATSQELQKLCQKKKISSKCQKLFLQMGNFPNLFIEQHFFHLNSKIVHLEKKQLNFEVFLFQKCPQLTELDLTCIPFGSCQVTNILQACSQWTFFLQKLILPRPSSLFLTNSITCLQLSKTIQTFCMTLQKWSTHFDTKVCHLRQLKLFPLDNLSPVVTIKLLEAISLYCPFLQQMDTWSFVVDKKNFIHWIELKKFQQIWTLFCSSCMELEAFDWLKLCFMSLNQHVLIVDICFFVKTMSFLYTTFGSFLKWRLKKMTMIYSLNLQDELLSVLAACPNLQNLRLLTMTTSTISTTLVDTESVNATTNFIYVLTQLCPQLVSIDICPLFKKKNDDDGVVVLHFNQVDISRLWNELTCLRHLCLRHHPLVGKTNATMEVVYCFLNKIVSNTTMETCCLYTFEVELGLLSSTSPSPLEWIIDLFAWLIQECPPGSFNKKHFALILVLPEQLEYVHEDDEEDLIYESIQFFIEKISIVHPSLCFELNTFVDQEMDSQGDECICLLYTKQSQLATDFLNRF